MTTTKRSKHRTVPFELRTYDPPLDAGIRFYVHMLNDNGIETYESCEGGEGHSYSNPTIAFRGTYGDGFRAIAICLEYGLPVFCLRRVWRMEQGEPVGPFWELEFTQKGPTDDPRCPSPARVAVGLSVAAASGDDGSPAS